MEEMLCIGEVLVLYVVQGDGMDGWRLRVVTGAVLAAVVCGGVWGGQWPTVHRDYQRSGYTEEVVAGPYERKWYRDFHEEMIATRVEAIVAGGRCFVGTFAGNMYALDVATGETVWTFKAAGPVGASPCYGDGKLYFGADEGFDTGHLYCVNAADGVLVWKYEAGAGIWVSPACDGRQVYFGDRAGVFHAVSVETGKAAWMLKTAGMILTPASFSEDGGRIVFGSEDMHVYCVSPAGAVLWKSEKLAGLSLRDHGPTIWKGLAIVRTNPADAFHTVMDRNGHLLKQTQLGIEKTDEDEVLMDQWGDLIMKPTPRRQAAEQDAIVRHLEENPYDKCFYALRMDDGWQEWTAPVFYTCGLHNPPTAPTFHVKTGELYTFCRSALTYYVRGVRRYNCMGRIDRATGRLDFTWPTSPEHRNWYPIAMIGDETQALSMMGDELICTHQGTLGSLNVRTMKVTPIWEGRDTYGGIFGPAAVPGGFDGAAKLAMEGYLTGMPNEWHGPDRSIVAVAEGRLFWVVGSQVVCIAGPDVPRTDSGGAKPPAMFASCLPACVAGGNVASRGGGSFDKGMEKRIIRTDELARFIEAPREAARTDAGARVQERLDAAVMELATGGPWAPFVVELGISGQERHFGRTAETMQIVALALPYLSDAARDKAVAMLDEMFKAGMPLSKPVFDGAGARREPYNPGPEMADFARGTDKYVGGIEDLYAVWAYAHYTGRWKAVIGQMETIKRVCDEFAGREFRFDHAGTSDDAERLNTRIAGVLGGIRILERSGQTESAGRLRELLAAMVTERVHHERADGWLIRPTKIASKGLHQAKAPRYVGLTPEVAVMLRVFAGEALDGHVRDLMAGLPLWYQAYGERMIGGENYISPPHLARGVFMAAADGRVLDGQTLIRKLDQPWCKADLYYIEKMTALLRQMGK